MQRKGVASTPSGLSSYLALLEVVTNILKDKKELFFLKDGMCKDGDRLVTNFSTSSNSTNAAAKGKRKSAIVKDCSVQKFCGGPNKVGMAFM